MLNIFLILDFIITSFTPLNFKWGFIIEILLASESAGNSLASRLYFREEGLDFCYTLICLFASN